MGKERERECVARKAAAAGGNLTLCGISRIYKEPRRYTHRDNWIDGRPRALHSTDYIVPIKI